VHRIDHGQQFFGGIQIAADQRLFESVEDLV